MVFSQVFALRQQKILKRNKIDYWVYTKKSSDSLKLLAQKFETSPIAIITLNRLKNLKQFKSRKKLFIPRKNFFYEYHRNRIYKYDRAKKLAEIELIKIKFKGIYISETGVRGGRVTSPFGRRIHPITGRWQFHKGIDYSAPKGTALFLSIPSKVIFTGRRGRYGKTIIVQSGKYKIVLAHLSKILVHENQVIDRLTLVGLVGRTGRTTGCHVHYEVRKDKKAINPLVFISSRIRMVVMHRKK